MKARDAPELPPAPPVTIEPIATRASAPAKPSKPKAKPQTDTGIKRAKKPRASKAKKPPNVTGYSWRRDGSGFELRKAVYDVSDTGIKKRRLPYVAHLSKAAYQDLKKRHKGAALDRAIADWIAEHDR